MRIIECSYEEHAGAILEIMNEAIVNSTALYEYAVRPPESMASWFEAKRQGDFPVLGAVDAIGALLGFATYGTFRVRPAYKYTVEHSVTSTRVAEVPASGARSCSVWWPLQANAKCTSS